MRASFALLFMGFLTITALAEPRPQRDWLHIQIQSRGGGAHLMQRLSRRLRAR